MGDYAILLDTRFCTGCNTCFYKCVQENRLHESAENGFTRTMVFIRDKGLYHHRCMHCEEPSCVATCPSGAFHKTPEGIVLYNNEPCLGCKSCVVACPFNVPYWNQKKKEIVKCTMCAHRVLKGEQPACVEACPTDALEFGLYQDITEKAKQIATKNNLHIYGLEENGGTSVIILTKENPITIGYPDVPKKVIKARGPKTVVGAAAVAALAYAGIKKYSERRADIEGLNKGKDNK